VRNKLRFIFLLVRARNCNLVQQITLQARLAHKKARTFDGAGLSKKRRSAGCGCQA
jgi:hypothetical protein